jgi:hypothetical protein
MNHAQADCHRRSGICGGPHHPALKKTFFIKFCNNIPLRTGKIKFGNEICLIRPDGGWIFQEEIPGSS